MCIRDSTKTYQKQEKLFGTFLAGRAGVTAYKHLHRAHGHLFTFSRQFSGDCVWVAVPLLVTDICYETKHQLSTTKVIFYSHFSATD